MKRGRRGIDREADKQKKTAAEKHGMRMSEIDKRMDQLINRVRKIQT